MIPSPQTVNVLRYTALGSGVIYGLYHQRRLTSQAKLRESHAECERKEALIQQAKAEWAKRHPSKEKNESGVISDPNDSRFDLEAFLQQLAVDQEKGHA